MFTLLAFLPAIALATVVTQNRVYSASGRELFLLKTPSSWSSYEQECARFDLEPALYVHPSDSNAITAMLTMSTVDHTAWIGGSMVEGGHLRYFSSDEPSYLQVSDGKVRIVTEQVFDDRFDNEQARYALCQSREESKEPVRSRDEPVRRNPVRNPLSIGGIVIPFASLGRRNTGTTGARSNTNTRQKEVDFTGCPVINLLGPSLTRQTSVDLRGSIEIPIWKQETDDDEQVIYPGRTREEREREQSQPNFKYHFDEDESDDYSDETDGSTDNDYDDADEESDVITPRLSYKTPGDGNLIDFVETYFTGPTWSEDNLKRIEDKLRQEHTASLKQQQRNTPPVIKRQSSPSLTVPQKRGSLPKLPSSDDVQIISETTSCTTTTCTTTTTSGANEIKTVKALKSKTLTISQSSSEKVPKVQLQQASSEDDDDVLETKESRERVLQVIEEIIQEQHQQQQDLEILLIGEKTPQPELDINDDQREKAARRDSLGIGQTTGDEQVSPATPPVDKKQVEDHQPADHHDQVSQPDQTENGNQGKNEEPVDYFSG